MGRKLRRKHLLKREEKAVSKPTDDPMYFFSNIDTVYTDHLNDSFRLMRQVKDCINEIYHEHINDLDQRKQKRLNSKIPTDFFQPYNLVVNSTYQQRIRSYIQELKKNEYDQSFKDSLILSMDIFIDSLYNVVKEFNGKRCLLQVIILYEAFHTLQNCIVQIGAIVEDVISRYNFELTFKKKFHSKIANEYYSLIENVAKKENSEYVDDALRMKANLESISKMNENTKGICIEHTPTLYSDSCSDEDLLFEPWHNLPIDELVEILSKESKKKSRRAKKKSHWQQEIPETAELDQEVEGFKRRLELENPELCRLKPKFSDEFLQRLRDQLKSNRV